MGYYMQSIFCHILLIFQDTLLCLLIKFTSHSPLPSCGIVVTELLVIFKTILPERANPSPHVRARRTRGDGKGAPIGRRAHR